MRTKKEAKNKARREAETIEHTITKESIEPQQQEQTIRQEKNLDQKKMMIVTREMTVNHFRLI